MNVGPAGGRKRADKLLHPYMAHCVAPRDAYFGSLYTALKTKGQSHGRALRSIGDCLLRMLVAMLREHTLYDSSRGQKVLMER